MQVFADFKLKLDNKSKLIYNTFRRCGPVVQLVRTPACHAGGRRFEPVPGRHRGGLLMLIALIIADMAQAVEHILGKDEVGGSSPPISSTKKSLRLCIYAVSGTFLLILYAFAVMLLSE